MKNKECFETYNGAWDMYYNTIVPQFGATRMEWGFGKWLWLECVPDRMAAWRLMDEARILTADGRKRLVRAEKEAAK